MKKIAIMTWYHYHNFGTALQVVASAKAIKKLGYEVDIIQYVPHAKLVSIPKIKGMRSYIKEKCTNLYKRINGKKEKNESQIIDEEKRNTFNNFLGKNITLTKKCNICSELFTLNNYYDAFICGSDQIWAPSIFNPKYFLDFADNPEKILAYAPSIGLNKIDDKYVRDRMKTMIERFEHLSIREEQGKDIIKEICEKNARVVLDPTLLLTAQEWNEIAVSIGEKTPYILCYFLGSNKKNWSHVERLSEKTNLPLKILPVFSYDYKRGHETVGGVGPGEFLDLVANATFLCTDSFHGVLFSVKFKKPFYVYERFSNKDKNSQNSRVYNILKLLNLESRLITNKTTIDSYPLECDYSKASDTLIKKIEESLEYLESALLKSVSVEKNVTDFQITNTCCGCGVCKLVCKNNAIEVKRDEIDGFIKAFIVHEKCIRCKSCKDVCSFGGQENIEINPQKHSLYMAKTMDKTVLKASSSGGLGHEIAVLFSEKEYDVVGCIYDNENREAVHKLVPSGKLEELKAFRGSKYIQSKTHEVFSEVLNESDKAIVFGTPCQIAGLDRVLKLNKKRDKHILVDLICHGVPTQHLWEKYLDGINKQYSCGLTPNVLFRDKSKGWREIYMHVAGNEKEYSKWQKKDLFYSFFELMHCYMPACYECAYRTASSADIRLGDYWGPRYQKDIEGVSMVIAMTDVGENILSELKQKSKILLEKNDCQEYWTVQYPSNPIRPVFYENLIADLRTDGISLNKIAKKYCKNFEKNAKNKVLYREIDKKIKKVLRRLENG
jgi:coenzyme F420-reducing hydrogenase beta subunit